MAWHGQFLFARDQLALHTPVAAAIGAFLELLMLGTNQRAHEHRRAGDRALPLRTFAIVCAALASLMNYTHFAGPDLTPTQQAVTYGFASVLGFTYWELVANARIRADHIAAGLRTPPRPIVTTGPGPRLSAPRLIARTLLHPIRTARAVDTSLTNPHLSVTQAWEASKQRDAAR